MIISTGKLKNWDANDGDCNVLNEEGCGTQTESEGKEGKSLRKMDRCKAAAAAEQKNNGTKDKKIDRKKTRGEKQEEQRGKNRKETRGRKEVKTS